MTLQAMIRSISRDTGKKRLLLVGATLFLLAAPAIVNAQSPAAVRYPFDPACSWGRIANGKGMLHRCITQKEAESLGKIGKGPGAAPPHAKSVSPEEPAESLPKDYALKIGPIEAEDGDISVGRLGVPTDRYRECIDKNGGLTKGTAKIVVKFLVRSERVRAEGVSVESRDGVSKAAAACVAGVVDRRKVGVPSVPMTAARLTFTLRQKK